MPSDTGSTAARGTLPVLVIAGYLGAGKTTLVNHVLRHAGGRRIAVLVNDFGDVDIDADLIEAAAGDASAGVLSLAGGCLCCSFGDDLVGTLGALAQREPPPEHVLIELSGVALPAAVVNCVRLAPAAQVVGTLAVVDAEAIRRQAADRYVGDTVRQQLTDADWLLLNKTDLLDPVGVGDCVSWLDAHWPRARRVVGRADALPPDWLLDALAPSGAPDEAQQASDVGDTSWAGRPISPVPAASTAHPFVSVSLGVPDGTDLEALAERLSAHGMGVLRAKALARDADGGGWLLQVAGARVALVPVPIQGRGRLVAIGVRGVMDPAAVAGLVGCDAPD